MVLLLRAALVLGGLVFILIGGSFLFDPVGQGGDFGLEPDGNQGLSTIRADFAAFFGVSGGALILGAWKQRGDMLLVAAALMGITLAGRAVSLALDGTYEGWQMPMAIEALTVVLALFGARVLPRPAMADPA
jgi:hypothetical protein